MTSRFTEVGLYILLLPLSSRRESTAKSTKVGPTTKEPATRQNRKRAYNGDSETMASAIELVAFMQRVLENFRPSLISEFRVLENNCPPIFSWKMILLYYRRMLRYMLFFFLNLSWKFWKSIFSRTTRLDIDNKYYYSRIEFLIFFAITIPT